MSTDEPRDATKKDLATGMLARTEPEMIPEKALLERWPIGEYKYLYTTGPFLLPENSGSLDWTLLNNAKSQQRARVTVFKCPVGAVKSPVAPGALVVTLDPGESTHNANEYPEGFAFEVVLECNSKRLFPYVSVWPGYFGVVIPGTGIGAGAFVRQMR